MNPTVVPGYLQNDFSRTTPHEYLMQAAPLQRAEHTVRAMLPDKRIGRMLKLEAGDACLLIMRRTWSFERIATVADLSSSRLSLRAVRALFSRGHPMSDIKTRGTLRAPRGPVISCRNWLIEAPYG